MLRAVEGYELNLRGIRMAANGSLCLTRRNGLSLDRGDGPELTSHIGYIALYFHL